VQLCGSEAAIISDYDARVAVERELESPDIAGELKDALLDGT